MGIRAGVWSSNCGRGVVQHLWQGCGRAVVSQSQRMIGFRVFSGLDYKLHRPVSLHKSNVDDGAWSQHGGRVWEQCIVLGWCVSSMYDRGVLPPLQWSGLFVMVLCFACALSVLRVSAACSCHFQ